MAATTTQTKEQVSLKLLVNKETNKVLFAEAGKDYCSSLKLNIDDTEPTKYFLCTKFPSCVDRCLSISLDKFKCRCKNPLNRSVMMKHFRNGFVNSGATFIIKDDLTVLPNSMDVTNFSLLQNFGIKSASSVKEMNVSVTKEKVLYFIFLFSTYMFGCFLEPYIK